jgi:hypothetical protein
MSMSVEIDGIEYGFPSCEEADLFVECVKSDELSACLIRHNGWEMPPQEPPQPPKFKM